MFVPIKKNIYKFEIKKSKFICIVSNINNINEINGIIDGVKKEYTEASHYLYAAKVDNNVKYDNDNEPGNITKRFIDQFSLMNINNVIVVVVRYFGGIKLGASNLLRTYSNLVSETLKRTKLGILEEVYLYRIKCDFEILNKLKRANYKIEKIEYLEKINIDIISKVDIINNLKEFKNIEIKSEKIKRVNYV